MKWIKNSRILYKNIRPSGEITSFDGACNHSTIVTNHRYLQTQSGYPSPTILQQASSGACTTSIQERLPVGNVCGLHIFWRGSLLSAKCIPYTISRRYGHSQSAPHLSRDWLVKLWVVEKETRISKHKRRQRVVNHPHSSGSIYEAQPTFKLPHNRWFSGSVAEERSNEEVKPVRKQPPISQSTIGFLEPTSPEELKVAPLLARSNLLITRDIEWANLVLGFEQENRYAIVDACYPESPAGYIREQSNIIARQILRTRRPFTASITDAMGNELFRIRRPFWWINSTIYAEIDGKEVGVVHRRWHLWRRIYDLYLGNMQFAVVENPGFWYWTFTLKDIDGNVLAEIDRDWRGFGFELLTDAGQYVIRFGQANSGSKTGPDTAITELETVRPLTLSERAVAVALAVSLDNDYFSRHGGWGLPFVAIGE